MGTPAVSEGLSLAKETSEDQRLSKGRYEEVLGKAMKECTDVVLTRNQASKSWGFRLIGGRDEGLVLKVDKILGLDTPASQCGLKAGDVIVQVEGVLVTMMTHPEVVELIRGVRGLQLTVRVQRGDHIVPNLRECFPVKDQEVGGEQEATDYYTGLLLFFKNSYLIQFDLLHRGHGPRTWLPAQPAHVHYLWQDPSQGAKVQQSQGALRRGGDGGDDHRQRGS